jgi:protein-S-isoprenylcysteine O-methyltransferase Ste14
VHCHLIGGALPEAGWRSIFHAFLRADRMQSDLVRLFYQQAFNALWLAWAIYWCVAAIGAKRTRYRESMASQALHIAPLFLGVALLVWLHPANNWLTQRYVPRSPVWFFAGLVMTVFGLGFAVFARVWLGRNWSATVTLKQDHELIRGGPYCRVRHPIYSGLLLAVLGSAIAIGEWRGLLALALITAGFLRKISVEERVLTEQFGDAYTRFRAEVPALLPGIY